MAPVPEPVFNTDEIPNASRFDVDETFELESENENSDAEILNDGYVPLNTEPALADIEPLDISSESESDPEPETSVEELFVTGKSETVHVWNEPRPEELDFELDADKQELIKSTMKQFKLPAFDSAPDWLFDEDILAQALATARPNSNSNTS